MLAVRLEEPGDARLFEEPVHEREIALAVLNAVLVLGVRALVELAPHLDAEAREHLGHDLRDALVLEDLALRAEREERDLRDDADRVRREPGRLRAHLLGFGDDAGEDPLAARLADRELGLGAEEGVEIEIVGARHRDDRRVERRRHRLGDREGARREGVVALNDEAHSHAFNVRAVQKRHCPNDRNRLYLGSQMVGGQKFHHAVSARSRCARLFAAVRKAALDVLAAVVRTTRRRSPRRARVARRSGDDSLSDAPVRRRGPRAWRRVGTIQRADAPPPGAAQMSRWRSRGRHRHDAIAGVGSSVGRADSSARPRRDTRSNETKQTRHNISFMSQGYASATGVSLARSTLSLPWGTRGA